MTLLYRGLPVKSLAAKEEPKPRDEITILPSAIIAARSRYTPSPAPSAPSPPPPPAKTGRLTKDEKKRLMRDSIDVRLKELRETNATRKRVMDYFEERIREIAD
jgi:hypothetical protein